MPYSGARLMGLRLILSCFVLLAGACSVSQVAAAQDPYPQRIISLGPTITEKLYLLGVEDRIVGVTIYCSRPPRAALKEKVGNVTHVNVEKMIRLKPDLVVATALTDSHLVKKLRQAHIRTELFPEPKSFDALNEQFIRLGKTVGKEQEARKIVAQASERVRVITDRVAAQGRPKVLCQIGANPLFVAVGDTLLSDMIERAQGENIAQTAKIGFYNREEVIRKNPDVIIIVTMGVAAENERVRWQKFRSINAVRNGRIFVMEAYRTCSPTPLTFADALADIGAALHPAKPGQVNGGITAPPRQAEAML